MLYSKLASVLALAALSTTSTAFVMDIYDSDNCSGASRNVNVWDNSCATWMGGFQSFRVTTYGGSHQKAYFFAPSNCGSLPGAIQSNWVDGGGYQAGACNNFGGNRAANAVASYSG